MTSFDEHRFRMQVDTALVQVRRILESSRNPVYAENVQHTYHDKFTVTEFLVKAGLSCNLEAFLAMGLSADMIQTMTHWSKERAVTLQFRFQETCTFDHEESKEVESTQTKVNTFHIGNLRSIFRSNLVTTVTEYFWKFQGKYELMAFRGVDANEKLLISSRTFQHELKSRVKQNPRFESKLHDPIEVDISWLLTCVRSEDLSVQFSIDREDARCRTPRRNPQVEKAISNFHMLRTWCTKVRQHFYDHIFSVWSGHKLDLSSINTKGVFVPVLPLLEDSKRSISLQQKLSEQYTDNDAAAQEPQNAEPEYSTFVPTQSVAAQDQGADEAAVVVVAKSEEVDRSVSLKPADMAAFLAEERRTIAQRCADVSKALPPADSDRAISAAEGHLLVCLMHLADIAQHLVDGLEYVEVMLRRQLTKAVGKVVGPADFAAYMRFHCRRLLLPEFEPRPFCYAVRRSTRHSPEGYISIEESFPSNTGPAAAEPVYTLVQSVGAGESAARPMEFSLNAAVKVRFGGERHVHGWVRHAFSGQEDARVFLSAQSRQFSSFVVLIGTIVSAGTFQPTHAMIVQNKEDVRIPLVLDSTAPSAGDFADAIESLSPAQQAFARSFRSLQAAAAVFAVCVVQVKPQLERLLGLPRDSLTKEIRLTYDLTELFTKYQIPSDLVSCGAIDEQDDGLDTVAAAALPAAPSAATAAAGAEKVNEVKRHVEAMRSLIDAFRQRELDEKREETLFSALDRFDADTVGALSSNGFATSQQRFRPYGAYRPRPCAGSHQGSRPPIHFNRETPSKRSVGPAAPAPPAAQPRFRPSMTPSAEAEQSVGADATPDAQAASREPPQTEAEDADDHPAAAAAEEMGDYSLLPALLDRRLEALDAEGVLRPTGIRPADSWTKRSAASLLLASQARPEPIVTLRAEGQRAERRRALELLDALTRGGAVPLEDVTLHVILAATHVHDKGVVDTVIEDGANPIDKAERSAVIMASVVAGRDPAELVRGEQLPRLCGLHPALFVGPPE